MKSVAREPSTSAATFDQQPRDHAIDSLPPVAEIERLSKTQAELSSWLRIARPDPHHLVIVFSPSARDVPSSERLEAFEGWFDMFKKK